MKKTLWNLHGRYLRACPCSPGALLVFMVLLLLAACSNAGISTITQNRLPEILTVSGAPPFTAGSAETDSEAAGILVAYFSHTGNTQKIAELIHQQVGGDIFEIKTSSAYPASYSAILNQAQEEKNRSFRPELSTVVENMEAYGIIVLCYPVWLYDLPMALYSFIEAYDFAGKTVLPVCTHGGKGYTDAFERLEQILPESTIFEGIDVKDSSIEDTQERIDAWLNELGLDGK
ncbi:MAG: NAD(P)H-dependent oxidoreductase [Clostridiales bacterium]|nr:NAD(P)H-dependent oxidoreductase [Clostridiales bacterium]